jgi:HK97 family phage prohead protease
MPCEVALANAQAPEGEQPRQVIVGQAIRYGSRSVDVGGYVRKFAKGCFSGSLGKVECMALYAHDDNDIVGREKNGSLRLADTDDCLTFQLDPPVFDPKFVGRIASGLVDKVSVGIVGAVDNWHKADDGVVEREIVACDLVEISFTSYPAFLDTSAELVQFDQFKASQQEQPRKPTFHTLALVQQQAEAQFRLL